MHAEMPLNSNVSQHKIDFYAIGEESGRTHPRRQKHKAALFRSDIYQSNPISGIFFPYLF